MLKEGERQEEFHMDMKELKADYYLMEMILIITTIHLNVVLKNM